MTHSLKKMIRNSFSASAFAIASLSMTTVLAPTLASAQEAPARQFGAKAGEIVNAANELVNANQYQAAISKLNEALAIPDLNPYEKAITYQIQGSSYYELNNYPAAIRAFENAISSGGLLPNESTALRVNIAQLLIGNEQFTEGAQMLENYVRTTGVYYASLGAS